MFLYLIVIVNRIWNKKAPLVPKPGDEKGNKPYRGTTPIPYCVTNPKGSYSILLRV